MEIKIRSMVETDLEQVLEIENICFTTPWSRSSFTFEINSNPMSEYYVAERQDVILGYAGIWSIVDESHVTTIAVDPKYRGEKIGRVLFETILGKSKEKEMKAMTLEVRETNFVAQNLYRSFGFVDIGIRPEYYQDNNEDAIIMLKEFKDVL